MLRSVISRTSGKRRKRGAVSVLASLVLLQVIAEEELREATFLHHRRCWFECCFLRKSAQVTLDRSLLGNDLIEVLLLPVDALQRAIAITVRVDAISQPSLDLLEDRGLPVRLVGRDAFKFRVIRVEGYDLLLADRMKTGKSHQIHLTEPLKEVFEEPRQIKGRNEYILSSPRGR